MLKERAASCIAFTQKEIMMLAPLLINLVVACVAVCLTINTKEEIVKVAAAFIAVISVFLCLFFAPWLVKLLIVAIPLLWEKLKPQNLPE